MLCFVLAFGTMSDSPEDMLVRAIMLLPLPSAMLLDIARHQSQLTRGPVREQTDDRFRILMPFEAFAKVLSAYHPAERKYRSDFWHCTLMGSR